MAARLLEVCHDGGNPLEACEAFRQVDTVGGANLVGKGGGDDGADDGRIGGHPSQFLAAGEDVVAQQGTHLVSRNEHIVARCIGDGAAEAVSVGVGGHHHVGLFLLGQLQRHLQGRCFFRIGLLYGGEVAVRLPLLRYRDDGEAQVSQHLLNVHGSRSVEGSVDNLHFAGLFLDEVRTEQLGLHHGPVLLVDFLVNHNQGASLDGLLLGDGLYLGDRIHLVDDALVVGLDDLGTVVPVGLVAVVLGRIVGGGHHHAGVAA